MCEPHVHDQETEILLADILSCLVDCTAVQNQPKETLELAERHFKVRMRTERAKPALGRHAGMAYSEMALGLMLNERFEEAIEYARKAREIVMELPLFKEGKYWPHFAVAYEGICLLGLGRGKEAIPMLQDALKFRERRFGPNDTESFKYVECSQARSLAVADAL